MLECSEEKEIQLNCNTILDTYFGDILEENGRKMSQRPEIIEHEEI